MIRGFKMELSEAQRVTDVYSEVAAITASDSQELATAMSKTASAASSVGMSFENTTAMIATMVEATRESATNIGSAMKSIIARMAEMKQGLSQDENGEFIDASKVETALKSVGVALRDTQGQFRDLDIVIGELGAKWDTLDSATQRYLATTIAGNRQQSRFLALMENYDRYTEIQNAALNSEDAGILQYTKTLDSLQSKLNQISNSFQQFYMSIINGPVIGTILNVINNIIASLSSLPKIISIAKVLTFVSQIKTVIQLVFNLITTGLKETSISIRQWRQSITGGEILPWAERLGQSIASYIAKGIQANGKEISGAIQGNVNVGQEQAPGSNNLPRIDFAQTRKFKTGRGLYIGGTLAQMGSALISDDTDVGYGWKTGIDAVGGAATAVGQALTGNIPGAILTGITTLGTLVSRIANAEEAQLERLKKETEEKNTQRISDKKEASTLQDYINKEAELRKSRYDSAEAMQKYLDISNEIAEKYPQYTSYIDESGNAIINMSSATYDLKLALDAAAKSTQNWAEKALETAKAELDKASNDLGLGQPISEDRLSSVSAWFTTSGDYDEVISRYLSDYPALSALSKKAAEDQTLGLDVNDLNTMSYSGRVSKLLELTGSDSLQDLANTLTEMTQQQSTIDSDSQEWLTLDTLISGTIDLTRMLAGEVFTNEQGVYDVNSKYAEYLNKIQNYKNTHQETLTQQVYTSQQLWSSTAEQEEKQWATKNDANKFIYSIAQERSLFSEDRDKYITDFNLQQYQELYDLYKSNIENFSEEEKETFDQFLEKPESLSPNEIRTLLTNENLDKEFKDSIVASWVKSSGDSYAAALKKYGQEEAENIQNYSEYYANFEDKVPDFNELKAGWFEQHYVDNQDSIVNKLNESQMATLLAWRDNVDKIIDETSSEGQRTAAYNIQDIINDQLDKIFTLEDKTLQTKLFNALFTDTGTAAWADNYTKLATEAGIEVNDIESAIYEAFASTADTAIQYGKSVIAKIEEISSKQSSGMSYEEANNYLRKLEWQDKEFDSVFSFRDGKYYFQNYAEAQDTYIASEQKRLDQYQKAIDKTNELIKDNETVTPLEDFIDNLSDTGLPENVQDAIRQYWETTKDTSWEAFKKWWATLTKEGSEAVSGVIDADNSADIIQAFTNINEQVSARKSKFSGPSSISDKDWFTANGYQGDYTEQALAQFAQARGYIYDSFTGEFTETVASIQQALNKADDPATKRALQARLDEAKKSLAETIADYTGSVTQEQINYLISQGVNANDLIRISAIGVWNDESIGILTESIDDAIVTYTVNQAQAIRNDSRLTNVKSSASSLLNDAAGASLDDLIGLVKDVFDNPDLVLDDDSLMTLQDVQKQGLPGIITFLEALNGTNGADFTAEIASYKEQYVSTAKSSVEKILTALASGEEVMVNDVAEVWEQLTGKTADESIRKAIAEAMKNGWQGVSSLLQSAVDQANVAPDFANQLKDILNSVIDAIREGVQSSISDLSSGISGSLSRVGVASLAKQSGISEGKILTNAKQTLQGYQLSQQGALDAAVGISQQSNGLYNVDIAKTLYDAYKGTSGMLGDYTQLNAKIASLEAGWDGVDKATENQIKLLKQLRSQYENAADNYDFLNPDYYDGVNDKFDNFLGTAKKMGDTFQSISDGEKVAYTDAMTFVNVLNKADNGEFAKTLEANGMSLEQFRDALNQTIDTSGNVDLAGMFSNIGLSMEMAGQDLEKGIQSFAEKRIEQLEGMKKFLESQKAIAEALKGIKFEMPQWDDPHSEEIITNQLALMDEMVQKAIPDFEEKMKQSYSSVLMTAIGLTPEQVAGFSEEQFSTFVDLANDLNQQWAIALENADWDVNNPDQYLQNFIQMLQAWAQSSEVQKQLATAGITIKPDIELKRSDLNKKIAEFNEGKAPEAQITIDTQYLNQDEITDINNLLTDTETSATDTATAVNEIGNKAKAAAESSKTLEERLKELKTQVDELTKNSHTVVISANTNPALLALQQVQRVLSALAKGTIIPITTQQIKMPVGGNDKSPNFSMVSKATGNVNGLAMYQGTQLAGKTLVGELGPELAVYDNAYHLLGKDGAEFVDIPDNAIIFNHQQTEGIINGQADVRGKTKNGGPAFATGTDAAIAAIDKEISLWKSLLNWTTKDLAGGGGGGGGSGNTIKAHIEDLVEWYNLSRQIADIEQKINNIIAERENITDGHEYLRSLREQQHLLEGQAIVQRTLLNYQQKQVELQAKQINTNSIWSKFFTVGEDGLLQYIMGNEENGGKGTLSMLQQLNQMSGEQQLSYIKGLGYSYTDNDGNVLDGEDLVAKFYEEAQAQIDKYDELRDTVEETDETLSKLQSSINEIEEEIRQNQLKLEQAIYDSIVSAWEKQISQLTEQMNLLKEANDAYVNGLSDALNKEKNLYNQNQSTSEREQLQRQLSLLRRAGGSASQIASLEEQLDSSLKNEYFNHQQESIDSIKEANEKQIDALNKQITIQQETLDFQKENGVLWTKVYEILSRSDSEILEFLVGNNGEFFTKSALAQREQLNTEWAKSIGIYKENNDVGYIGNRNAAADNFATEAWNSAKGAEKKKQFEAVSKDSQELLKDYFASAYANAKLNGMDDKEAFDTAREDMYKKLYSTYTEQIGAIGGSTGTTDGQTGGGSGNNGNSNSNNSKNNNKNGKTYSTISVFVSAGKGGGRPTLASSGGATSAKVAADSRIVIAPNPFPGYVFDYITYNGTKKSSMSITATGKVASINIKVYYKSNNPEKSGGQGGKDAIRSAVSAATGTLVGQNNQPALLHKGEGVFTAKQTSALIKMVDNFQQLATGNVGASLLASLLSTTKNYSNLRNDTQQISAVNVNPGAVVIQVEQLNDKYDIDSVATDVFNKITSIASKATSRGVNRR